MIEAILSIFEIVAILLIGAVATIVSVISSLGVFSFLEDKDRN